MQRKQAIFRGARRRLLARASALAIRMALKPRGWAPALLAVGLIGTHGPTPAQEVIDLATDADLVIQGANLFVTFDGDRSGSSVSGAGDVNGDGINDLIIGAPGVDVALELFSFGASYVIFGDDQGFPPTIDLATNAELIIQGSLRSGEGSGVSVSGAGDVNADGIDDVIIGATLSTVDVESAGASYVVFGTDQGFPPTIPTIGVDSIIQGVAPGDFSGRSVSGAGDVNGDGIDDLIIGGSGVDPNGRENAGASYVVFGTDPGLPAVISLLDPPTNDNYSVIQGAAAGEQSGRSVSGAGDVNGDGIDDLIIGAPFADPDSAGTSYVVFGSDQGLPPTIDLADPVGGADVVIKGAAAGDQSGRSVSDAGDVNGDGIDDLIIGAPGANANAGASYVVFGTDQGFPLTIDLATDADLVIQGADVVVVFDGDRSGSSVSGAGDVNGDGIDDLIIGAPLADPNGRGNAGTSYVVFGGPEAAIERLIARVEAAELPGGIENSRTRKLSNALGSLARGQSNGAIGKVGAFINEVEAQFGRRIDEADADAWIAAVETILDNFLSHPRPSA